MSTAELIYLASVVAVTALLTYCAYRISLGVWYLYLRWGWARQGRRLGLSPAQSYDWFTCEWCILRRKQLPRHLAAVDNEVIQ